MKKFKKGDIVMIKKGSEPNHNGEYAEQAKKDAGLIGVIEYSGEIQCRVRTIRKDTNFYWPVECLILCNDLEREQMLELESVL